MQVHVQSHFDRLYRAQDIDPDRLYRACSLQTAVEIEYLRFDEDRADLLQQPGPIVRTQVPPDCLSQLIMVAFRCFAAAQQGTPAGQGRQKRQQQQQQSSSAVRPATAQPQPAYFVAPARTKSAPAKLANQETRPAEGAEGAVRPVQQQLDNPLEWPELSLGNENPESKVDFTTDAKQQLIKQLQNPRRLPASRRWTHAGHTVDAEALASPSSSAQYGQQDTRQGQRTPAHVYAIQGLQQGRRRHPPVAPEDAEELLKVCAAGGIELSCRSNWKLQAAS